MITEFLSEENIALHKEYVRQKRLKLSIIESYLPRLADINAEHIHSLRLDKKDKADVLALLPEITLHEVYFSSFAKEENLHSETVTDIYGSDAAFLNRLYRAAVNSRYGFLTVGRDASFAVVTDYPRAFVGGAPALAVDLCEHAYFLDYGFDRERYILSCLSHLDLRKITT